MEGQNFLQQKEIMEIQDKIKQIKTRQLGRLMQELKAVHTPQIILDAVEKYWNFCYLDILDCLNQNTGNQGNYDKSSNK